MEKTNHFFKRTKRFYSLKLYYDLLDEILIILVRVILKHMDLMNIIYNEDHNKKVM